MFDLIRDGLGEIIEFPKLAVQCRSVRLVGTNEVVVRNADQRRALRFTLRFDGNAGKEIFIGDGIVAATPFGSTGYYHSVTGTRFGKGIGLAFNNCTISHDPVILNEKCSVELVVERSRACVTVDNAPEIITVTPRDSISITQAEESTRLLSHRQIPQGAEPK
ncbi:MAG: hypothetical protein GF401_08820 [Chitinivibrionales bacterium]|nr:hypothetical protein [Chitinivibrionales bacterium]